MKKLLIGFFAFLGLAAVMSVSSANAAGATAVKPGPYEGEFYGTVTAPNGSEAVMSLDLAHRGNVVSGTVMLDEGLSVDAGMCGAAAVPASSITASGKTMTGKPNILSAVSEFEVNGIAVQVELNSQLKGDVLTAAATIDLPWLCGSDPVITGELYRA